MFTIKLNEEYVDTANDLYQLVTILLTTHVILSLHTGGKGLKLGLGGSMFNDDFVMILGSLMLGILAYELVYSKVIIFT
uniref:Uncharacterized protein n=1 Tax=viral metagenome TaxID=1070528 RepID=A0A6C0J7E9_9ZZZZ